MPGAVKSAFTRTLSTSFKQQELRSCVPLYRPCSVILFFAITGIIFIPIGVTVFVLTNNCQEYTVTYAANEHPDVVCTKNALCTFRIPLDKPMKTPVYVYYQLTNFYQNHREYIRSRATNQLRGDNITDPSELADCEKLKTADLSNDLDMMLTPCGMGALAVFNDSISLFLDEAKTTPITLDKSDITWKSDRGLYKNPEEKFGVVLVDDFTNPDFINWMRPAVAPNFRKLYGVIKDPGELKDEVYVTVANFYDVSSFNGTKSVILATTSIFGSKNPALGVIYMATGGVFILVAIALLVITFVTPRFVLPSFSPLIPSHFLKIPLTSRKLADKRFLRW